MSTWAVSGLTNSGVLTITSTSGSITDAGDSSGEDIQAPNAALHMTAHSGIGALDALEIQVAGLNLTNTGTGAVQLQETDALVINGIAQASGSVSLEIGDLAVIQGAGVDIATTGDFTLTAQGGTDPDTGDAVGIDIDAAITTGGGSVALSTQTYDLDFSAGIDVDGAGNIDLLAPKGSVLNSDDNWQYSSDWYWLSGGSPTTTAYIDLDIQGEENAVRIQARDVGAASNGVKVRYIEDKWTDGRDG